MRKRPEALGALEMGSPSLRVGGGWLDWAGGMAIRGCHCSGVGFLRDHPLVFLIIDYVARLVPKALGFGKSLDQRFRLDCQEAFLKAFVQKTVACFADDEVGNLIQCFGGKVADDLMF